MTDLMVSKLTTLKRFVLPTGVALVTLTVVGVAGASTLKHKAVSSGQSHSQDQPRLNVDGQPVAIPANGTTTVKHGNTETTVTHQGGSNSQPDVTSTSTTTTDGGSVHIDVASGGENSNSSQSVVTINGDSSHQSVQSHVSVTSHSSATIHTSH